MLAVASFERRAANQFLCVCAGEKLSLCSGPSIASCSPMVSTHGLVVASLALLLPSALAADCSRASGGNFSGTAITLEGGATLRFSEVCVCVCVLCEGVSIQQTVQTLQL